jgi:hypothetical protein
MCSAALHYGHMGVGVGEGAGNRWRPHMQETWNSHGDAVIFRVGASPLPKKVICKKSQKNDELTDRVDPAKPAC